MKDDNIYLQYLRELMINWRCIQKKPIGGCLMLIKNDLEEDFIEMLESHLHDFKVNEDEFHWNGTTIKLV
jgi:hypothetical protein